MQRAGVPVPLPDCPAPFLVEYLMDIGPVISGGMGPSIVGWRDIAAWSDITGITLDPWQSRLIRRLSADYLAASLASGKPDCPAPYVVADQAVVTRDVVSAKVSSVFKMLASRSVENAPAGRNP